MEFEYGCIVSKSDVGLCGMCKFKRNLSLRCELYSKILLNWIWS